MIWTSAAKPIYTQFPLMQTAEFSSEYSFGMQIFIPDRKTVVKKNMQWQEKEEKVRLVVLVVVANCLAWDLS